MAGKDSLYNVQCIHDVQSYLPNIKILECRKVNLKAGEEVLGSILASSDTVESGGRQMNQY